MKNITLERTALRPSFASEDYFRPDIAAAGYTLLPFRFLRLDSSRYVVTNLVGEYVLLTNAQLRDFASHKIDPSYPIYDALKSKHFLFDSDSTVAIDLLACKYRTKLSYLSRLTSLFMFVVTLRCEHSCPYCQVSRQTPDRSAFDMKVEDAAKAIDLVFVPSPKTLAASTIEMTGGTTFSLCGAAAGRFFYGGQLEVRGRLGG